MQVDVEVHTHIARPPQEVAAYAGDPGNAPEWYANIRSVEWRTPPPVGLGSRMDFVAGFLGRRLAYTYEVEELPDDRYRRVKVRIHHPGFETPGSYHDKIVVRTTHPERPEVQVSAHIHVVDRIVFRARTISLGFVRAGAPRGPTKARIEPGAPGVEFAVTGVEILPPEGESFGPGGVPFVANHGKDGRGWWVEVRYDGKPRQAGLIEAILRVRTDDRAQPELRIPVRATLRTER